MSEINTHDFVVPVGANYDTIWSERVEKKIKESEANTVFVVRSQGYKELLLTLARELGRAVKVAVRYE